MTTPNPDEVTLFEVGPRDGLQNIQHIVPTASKIELIDALSQTGLRNIETTSFVNPKRIPQLADATDVMSGIARNPNVTYTALTPNIKGTEAAIAAECDETAVFISASEGFSRANINCSVETSIVTIKPAIERALAAGLTVRGYLSCVVECPFDGAIDPMRVAHLTKQLLSLGCYEVSLGDTIGAATPETTQHMLEVVLQSATAAQIAGHFHDTKGRALSNIECALDYGIRTFDTAIAGLGGCPFAPGAPGNADTRVVLEHLQKMGFTIDLDIANIKRAEAMALKITNPQNRTIE